MFDAAIAFLTKMRTDKADALNNKVRRRWSTASVAALSTLATDTFGSKDENDAYSQVIATRFPKSAKLQAIRLKIGFLAGCRQDVLEQYSASDKFDPVTAADTARYDMMSMYWANYALQLMKQDIKTRDAL
jgi:hypothetical protein